ncbi:hypothetical protein Vadar_018562 [Vaccinium darrowii]|uniref:Uncharacterized protein n=1 Tax=Vaccinium darrowii TaxID=229202 RepID=A0ACB7ZLD2_9ERIC|nr:hypothetical protein Vadar_018562 [Vaccinium darrowii]
MVQLMAEPTRAITCDQVDACLVPCMSYLLGGGNPAVACCDGLKNLEGMASPTADKQAACNCVKKYRNTKANAKWMSPSPQHKSP